MCAKNIANTLRLKSLVVKKI